MRLTVLLAIGVTLAASAAETPAPPALPATLPDLPLAVSNNAVAAVAAAEGVRLYSLMGIGASKRWDAITRRVFELRLGESPARWREIAPVPGARGRIAATAAGVGGRVYLFGGYTVDAEGQEISLANVDIYDPASTNWSRGADIPVAVDDAVSGVYRERWVYLVSGWSQRDNVAAVQLYDTVTDSWRAATAIVGTPVFGQTGGLAGETILYCGGAHRAPAGERPKYRADASCWRGTIAAADPTRIAWTRLARPAGVALYRGAAGSAGDRIFFVGGSDNPYNYDGIGYDGEPSAPVATRMAFDAASGTWQELGATAAPTMDHRGLLVVGDALVRLGGMAAEQRVGAGVAIDRVASESAASSSVP